MFCKSNKYSLCSEIFIKSSLLKICFPLIFCFFVIWKVSILTNMRITHHFCDEKDVLFLSDIGISAGALPIRKRSTWDFWCNVFSQSLLFNVNFVHSLHVSLMTHEKWLILTTVASNWYNRKFLSVDDRRDNAQKNICRFVFFLLFASEKYSNQLLCQHRSLKSTANTNINLILSMKVTFSSLKVSVRQTRGLVLFFPLSSFSTTSFTGKLEHKF